MQMYWKCEILMFLETSVSLCIKLTVLLSSEYLSGYANAIVRNRSRPHSVSVRSVISLSLSLSLSFSLRPSSHSSSSIYSSSARPSFESGPELMQNNLSEHSLHLLNNPSVAESDHSGHKLILILLIPIIVLQS